MTKRTYVLQGVGSGLAGGVVFGFLMGMMGMLPMVAKLVGSGSAVVGFGVHLVISATIGATYGLLVADRLPERSASLIAGAAYGFFWWLLGPLTLMPWMLGMGFGTQWTLAAAVQADLSLMGHLLYGVVLAFTYHRLQAGCACS